MLTINTNIAALQAQSAQQTNARSTATVMQQLSTSKRINSAVDDVAGLAISTRLMSQIKGANQAIRNANDGISLLQTAEGAIEGITNALQRMRELRVQSLSETNNPADKASIENEITSLQTEIKRILSTTEFNGIKLLNGSATASTNGFNFTTDSNGGHQNVSFYNQANSKPLFENLGSLQIVVPENMEFGEHLNFEDFVGGDFNGDGIMDVGVTLSTVSNSNTMISEFQQGPNISQTKLEVRLGDGHGNFSAPISSYIGNSWIDDPSELQQSPISYVQDFNGDGRSDVAVVKWTWGPPPTDASLEVSLSNSDGTLQPSVTTQIHDTWFARPTVSGDFNGDGKTDMIVSLVSNSDQFEAHVFLGDGQGGFQQLPNQFTGMAVYDEHTGDFNSDGILDFVAESDPNNSPNNGKGTTVSIYIGNGDGTFKNPAAIMMPEPIDSMHTLAVSDFNQDGVLDVAIQTSPKPLNYYTSPGILSKPSELSIFQGMGDGTFKMVNTITLENDALISASSDFNGDGINDLAITYDSTLMSGVMSRKTDLQILTGNGDFSFRTETPIPLVPHGSSNDGVFPVLLTDANNDGNLDTFFRLNDNFSVYSGDTFPIYASVTKPSNATSITVDEIDSFLATISKERANIGASISALTFTVDNLTTLSTKTQEAMSRIQDTDYAVATTELAKRQIIQQAAMAMMAQANQNPQVILQLLKSTTS